MTQHPLFDVPSGLDQRVYPSGVPSVDYNYKADPGGQSGVLLPTNYQEQAKDAIAEYYNQFLRSDLDLDKPIVEVIPDDVFVISFEKVLQNWKAYCSTIFEDDRLFVLTYNGDKRELYVDEYVKKANKVFTRNIPSQRIPDEHC